MSDVANAPAPPSNAPAAPASAPASEVPINPNPQTAPQPIGNQAPDKPADAKPERKPESRREVIQRAFEKAEASRPKAEAAKPKIGHNQPPEQIDRERPTLDLKKPPGDQPQRERTEHGHFAPRAQNDAQTRANGAQNAQNSAQPAQQQPSQHRQLPEGTPFRDPLPRMSEKAKADWHATPESVRGDLYRAQNEFQRAYGQYRADHQVMETIRPFHQMAAQHGTTLERALSNYTQMEQKLRQDPIAGLDIIVHNLNLRAEDGSKIGLRDIAWHILNQSPEQHQLVQAKNAATAQSQQIGQLHQIVNQLATGMQQMQYAQQFTQTRSALDQYADGHPRFDELGDLIEREIKLGFTLDQAYARANLLRPATHAAQTRSTTTAQTRPAGKSISGAPSGPPNGTGRRPEKPVGRREAIASAIKRANGSL